MKLETFEFISVPAKEEMKDLHGGLLLLFSHNNAKVEDDICELQEEVVWYYKPN